ncbi:hypothetical protein [Sutcliffiella cohnii]|uniref:hypothetical protein n=1 Tax=Sutcliffiella cohnii TaxID=33932 RepID=UPI002E249319|nr:hypothetical protein [Sutcliffiella cohnii]
MPNYNHTFSNNDYSYLNSKEILLYSNTAKELNNFLNWVEKRILLLDNLTDFVKLGLTNNIDFQLTCDELKAFVNYFNSDFKPSIERFIKTLKGNPNIEKMNSFLDIIKKPFDEIKNYPKNSKLSVSDFNEWFSALVESLEKSTQKLLKFSSKLGYPIKIVQKHKSKNNTETFESNYKENYIYNEPYVGGSQPSSSVAVA